MTFWDFESQTAHLLTLRVSLGFHSQRQKEKINGVFNFLLLLSAMLQQLNILISCLVGLWSKLYSISQDSDPRSVFVS